MGKAAATVQAMALIIAFVALITAFLSSDFSGKLVASNSHSLKPWFFKIAATWGNHEGSMLLWALILALYGAFIPRDIKIDAPLRDTATGIMGILGAGVCLFLLVTSNPFDRLDPAPFEGRGLNPLLQDIALVIHPPILYAGYVGFAAPYALTLAALLHKTTNKNFANILLRWSLAPVAFLTLGVGLGSCWAYRELGWGGWWFWDPVENASLMPWLMGVASVHLALLWRRSGQYARFAISGFIATFSFSVLGTFIVRSGALTSVHSFAVDPLRGTLILLYLFGVIGFGCLIYYRSSIPKSEPLQRTISRELFLLAGASLLIITAITIAIGTLYPLFIEALRGEPLTVGAPYFNKTATPMLAVIVLLMAVATASKWHAINGITVFKKPILVSLAVGAFFAGASWLFQIPTPGQALIAGTAFTLPAFVFYQEFILNHFRQTGIALAHLGFTIAAVGMVGSATLSRDIVRAVKTGDVIETPHYSLNFGAVERRTGPNYVSEFSKISVESKKNGTDLGTLIPERRWYPAGDTVTTEAAIRSTFLTDLYITLGDLRTPNATEPDWALRIRHRPFMSWIWFGLVLTFVGGLLSAFKRGKTIRPSTAQATIAMSS